MRNTDWYHSLKHPPLNPPDWLFQPVWTALYFMILVSFILFITSKAPAAGTKTIPVLIFIFHMLLNFFWSPVFFGMKKTGAALLICLLMWLTIPVLIYLFYPFSPSAAMLLIPYFLWTTFALYLNFGIWVMNR